MSQQGLLKGDVHVSNPSPEITAQLKGLLPSHPFHIKAEEAAALASQLSISKEQLMVELIPVAREYAAPVVPISNFQVGSCALGESGDLYLGVNMEFVGENLAQTVHSEQSSFANLMIHGERSLVALAVSSEPCGGCRQFLNELAGAQDLRIMIPERPLVSLCDLLPRSFGPRDLGIQAGMLAAVENPIHLPQGADSLVNLAWQAANRAYAPYSHCNAGVALEYQDGQTVSGWYVENAAFNPSLSPLQAALIMGHSLGRSYAQIARAVLVERQGAPVTHAPAFRSLLGSLAPQAELLSFATPPQ